MQRILIFTIGMLWAVSAFSQADTVFVLPIEITADSTLTDSTFRITCTHAANQLPGTNFLPTGIQQDHQVLDGFGRLYRVKVVQSSDLSGSVLDVVELQNSLAPAGTGVVYRKQSDSECIPVVPMANSNVAPATLAAIFNHNAVNGCGGGSGGGGSSLWMSNGFNIYYDGGNVGIGTTNPTQSLTVDNVLNLVPNDDTVAEEEGNLRADDSQNELLYHDGISEKALAFKYQTVGNLTQGNIPVMGASGLEDSPASVENGETLAIRDNVQGTYYPLILQNSRYDIATTDAVGILAEMTGGRDAGYIQWQQEEAYRLVNESTSRLAFAVSQDDVLVEVMYLSGSDGLAYFPQGIGELGNTLSVVDVENQGIFSALKLVNRATTNGWIDTVAIDLTVGLETGPVMGRITLEDATGGTPSPGGYDGNMGFYVAEDGALGKALHLDYQNNHVLTGNLQISGTLNVQGSYTPSSTSDSTGDEGDISYDDDYVYIKTSAGWKRAALSTF